MTVQIPKFRWLAWALVFGALFIAAALVSGCDQKAGVRIGDTAPGISDTDINGEVVSLKELRGKVVVLYFWANSCCGKSLIQTEPVYRRHRAEVALVAINGMDHREDVVKFAHQNGLTFTLLTDEHAMLMKQYQVLAFPTVFILDRNGIVRERILGDAGPAKLEKLIRRQLEAPLKAGESYDKLHHR
ncbi:peroxiredoxin family protein [Geomesophilobacter sediminis]|uniref:TlpA family protein disulfide reductase n=1 Tax=Geomesophilobacter sediminis TaxID=2798584 RepID=A0A8J7SCK0_9BACT|nr:TlpA disulfide reductase family protein [Geomesophilobacter sediminis]MBJ6727229.1 TlpA family protein disulfide reductase [Geomesophilobacter sediminis]